MHDVELNFQITSCGELSNAFLAMGISSFAAALDYVKNLPYGRNNDKRLLTSVLTDHCGTCSTKHALLKSLADEHDRKDVRLILCLFRMNGKNTPAIADILNENGLDHLPEAHNYLRVGTQVFDGTFPGTATPGYLQDIISEVEIEAHQVPAFKINFHQEYLRQWLQQSSLKLSFEEVWQIREACIERLAGTKG
jgi:hypothetical protein